VAEQVWPEGQVTPNACILLERAPFQTKKKKKKKERKRKRKKEKEKERKKKKKEKRKGKRKKEKGKRKQENKKKRLGRRHRDSCSKATTATRNSHSDIILKEAPWQELRRQAQNLSTTLSDGGVNSSRSCSCGGGWSNSGGSFVEDRGVERERCLELKKSITEENSDSIQFCGKTLWDTNLNMNLMANLDGIGVESVQQRHHLVIVHPSRNFKDGIFWTPKGANEEDISGCHQWHCKPEEI